MGRKKDPNECLKQIGRDIDFLTANVTTAIRAYELYSFAASNAALLKRIDHGYPTAAFVAIRHSLHGTVTMSLVRCWDKQRNALSVERVAAALNEPTVRAAIRSRRVEAWYNVYRPELYSELTPEEARAMAKADSARAEERGARHAAALDQEIARIWTMVRCVTKRADEKPLGALQRLRNSVLAHTDTTDWDSTPPEHHPKARKAVFGDERVLLARTERIVERLSYTVNNVRQEYNSAHRVFRKAAKIFWSKVGS